MQAAPSQTTNLPNTDCKDSEVFCGPIRAAELIRPAGQPNVERGRSLNWGKSALLRYAVALLSVEVATLARMQLDPVLGYHSPHATFFLAAIISAGIGGWKPGLLALVLGELVVRWLFMPNVGSFLVGGDVSQWIGSCTYFVVSGAAIGLGEAQRISQRGAETALARLQDEMSERKIAEEERYRLLLELEKERGRLNGILQQSPVGVIIAEFPSGKVLFGNDEAARILRRSSLASLHAGEPSRHWRGFHADGRPYESGEWPLARAITRGETVQDEEIQVEFEEGGRINISVNAAPIEDPEGRVVAGIMTLQDVTEKRRTQARLAAFSQLGQSLSSVRTPLEAARIIGSIAEELLGWDAFSLSLCETEGTRYQRILQVDTIDGKKCELKPYEEKEIPSRMVRILQTGAELILKEEPLELLTDCVPFGDKARASASLMFAPIREQGSGLGVLSIQSYQPRAYDEADLEVLQNLADYCGGALRRIRTEADLAQSNERNRHLFEEVTRQKRQLEQQIAERRQAEKEVHRLNADLERRVRERTQELLVANQELEAFCYSVSHDLRAPLRSIAGFTQAVTEDCGESLPSESQQSLGLVIQATREMDQLIEDLLGLSRLTRSEMKRQSVNLSDCAQEIAAGLGQRDPGRVVEWVIAPDVVVQGDARLLRIALENLLSNAWKFSGKRAQARIEFGVEFQAQGPVYFVRDNGAGFDMTYASRLFTAFQRLHTMAEFPGHGIGLATVQRIIHRHGGHVWPASEVDKGATFYFNLPANMEAFLYE